MKWRQIGIRKGLVVIILSFGIMPNVLSNFFSANYVSYSTGIFLSFLLFTLFGLPCSIASEWITLKFKQIMRDFHPVLVACVSGGAYVSLHFCFGLLIICLAVLHSPYVLTALTVIYSVLIGALLFAIIDLIIAIVQIKKCKAVVK